MQAYDRRKGKIVKLHDYGNRTVSFLYHTAVGRIFLKALSGKSFSKIMSRYYKSKFSHRKISKTIEEYNIDLEGADPTDFSSFDDFFNRRPSIKNRPLPKAVSALPSVADAKLLVKEIRDEAVIEIKNTVFTLSSLLAGEHLVDSYRGGLCLIFRLTVDNCHNFVFPDSGEVIERYKIDGKLHSVQPITNRQHKVFAENYRHISMLDMEHLGSCAYIEIGALMVGRIVNNDKKQFSRGEEKGYFELGGSTIILLIGNGKVKIDDDIMEYSKKGIETIVKMNEKIGGVVK